MAPKVFNIDYLALYRKISVLIPDLRVSVGDKHTLVQIRSWSLGSFDIRKAT